MFCQVEQIESLYNIKFSTKLFSFLLAKTTYVYMHALKFGDFINGKREKTLIKVNIIKNIKRMYLVEIRIPIELHV